MGGDRLSKLFRHLRPLKWIIRIITLKLERIKSKTHFKSTQKADLKMTFMEKEMATHYSILAWKNLWTEESGGLKSIGLHD